MPVAVARGLYTLFLYIGLPFLLFRLWWRGRHHPGYRQRIGERLGWVNRRSDRQRLIWVHAVSVGEVQAAAPLVQNILRNIPEFKVLLTTTTPTGADNAQRLFGARVAHAYFPYDLPNTVSRFLGRIRPALLLLMETELWPNLLQACRRRGVRTLLVNGRLSERAARRYRRLLPLVKSMLQDVDGAAVQTQTDAERFIELGLPSSRLRVSGSVKFDQPLPPDLPAQIANFRAVCAGPRPIWIAASTHQGEEEVVLHAHLRVLKQHPRALLLLAPRHPVRAEEALAIIHGHRLTVRRRSRGEVCDNDTQVFLIDTLGELLPFLGVADVAFMGGSLVAVGGHNMIEPAAVGVPVLFGPNVFNFSEISRLLLDAGAAVLVQDAESLGHEVERLLSDRGLMTQRGNAAREVVRKNSGAVQAVMEMIGEALGYA